ncbi:MAG: ABC transporter permease [Flavipsychrobacter sp.]|nr:ABC transporter permease [Flavipsychrobacter sp.]
MATQNKFIFSRSMDMFFQDAAELAQFTVAVIKEGVRPPYEFREVLNQCYETGIKSFILVGITAFILGLVLIMQSRPTLVEFGAGSFLPAMSSVSIVREIGPLVTALICAGKIGSGISAELGSMKVTEQIDAMEVSGTNPFKFLIATRIMATTLMIPVLTLYAILIALTGAFTAASITDQVNIGFFFNRVFDTLKFSDVIPSFTKTFFFGFAIGLVGCTKGYNSKKGTEGVGKAANASVVIAMLSVIVIDMVVTRITAMLGYL